VITSKLILRICEKYLTRGSFEGIKLEIFENPTSSDFVSLAKAVKEETGRKLLAIRFVADARYQKVYIADAYNSIHQDIRDILKLPPADKPGLINGIATVSGNRAIMSELSSICPKEAVSSKWTWVNKYISGCSSMIRN
jgi:hypothetical protein